MSITTAMKYHTERIAVRMANKGYPHKKIEEILRCNLVLFKDFYTGRYTTAIVL